MNKPSRSYLKPDEMGAMFDIPRGWYRLVDDMCAEIDVWMREDLNNSFGVDPWDQFEVFQVKQKFWTLRIYVEGVPQSRQEDVKDLISNLEKRARCTCAECGASLPPDGNPIPSKIGEGVREKMPYCDAECREAYFQRRTQRIRDYIHGKS